MSGRPAHVAVGPQGIEGRGRWGQAALIGLALIPLILALAFWAMTPSIGIDADSPRYLEGSAMRTATYPIFLDLVNGPALLPLQLFLFGGSLSWFAIYVGRFLAFWLTALLTMAIAINPYVWQLQGTILSESLTTPLLTIIAGCLIAFSIDGRSKPMVVAAFFSGLAVTIRPALFAIILALFIAVWIVPGINRFRLAALTLLAFTAPIVAERAYSRAVHGSELTSPMGRHAFMKAAVLDAPPTKLETSDPLRKRLVQALNRDFEPVRKLIAKAEDRNLRYILLTNYEACSAWACGNSIIRPFAVTEAELHKAMFDTGIARLKDSPTRYASLTLGEYHRMWLLHPRKHPELAREYNDFLKREAPIPFQSLLGEEGQPTPSDQQSEIYRFNRWVFAAIGIAAGLLTIIVALWHRTPVMRGGFMLLAGTQAVLLFSAAVAVGLPRYPMGLWPVLVSGLLMAVVGLAATLLPFPYAAEPLGQGQRMQDGGAVS